MEEKYLTKLIEIEQRGKSNTKRIDEHEERIEALEKTYSVMEKMNYRMGKVETAVDNIDKKLDEKQDEKGKKWDKLVDYVFYSILAVILGLIYVKLGLN